MIGGFLGAGKTTAVAQLGQHLTEKGSRVGLITNDQSVGLVDTAMLRGRGFDVEEIAGGCFCCRFDSLVDAATKLSQLSAPEVFIAEPVGSCTDLIATVSYPLRRIYGDRYTIAPLSVIVDPVRASRVLGLDQGRSFSDKVVYVYRKQLEEANIIVINKCDIFPTAKQDALESALRQNFPLCDVVRCSAKTGVGLDSWFDRILADEWLSGSTMTVDYDTYAQGESLLGWLNATVKLSSSDAFDGEVVMMDLAELVRDKLVTKNFEIAHLKMTLLPTNSDLGLAGLSIVSQDMVPELWQSLLDRIKNGLLIVNLRAESKPDVLREVVDDALAICARKHGALTLDLEHMDAFSPAKPSPTHRIEVA